MRTVRDKFKLNRADVGWYQVRNAQAARNVSVDTAPVNFGPIKADYRIMSDKLRLQAVFC